MSRNIAYVAVENALYHFDRRFSYRIPDGLAVQPGCRVVVPFGRGNSRRQGIVLDIGESEGSELKDISKFMIELSFWRVFVKTKIVRSCQLAIGTASHE